jgi:16S rRNA pseudouridine516 synthase
MRLLKFLSLAVAMSRNQARYFIVKGRVSVDGNVVTDPNFTVEDAHEVTFDNELITVSSYHYFLLHKPASYLCANKDGDFPSVLRVLKNLPEDSYYYFANLLGPETTGLVLLSNDIAWTKRISSRLIRSKKIYHVKLVEKISNDQLAQLNATDVSSEQENASVLNIERLDDNTLLLTLTQGGYHEIEQRLTSVGLTLEHLCLQQVGRLSLGDLTEGDCLALSPDQIKI